MGLDPARQKPLEEESVRKITSSKPTMMAGAKKRHQIITTRFDTRSQMTEETSANVDNQNLNQNESTDYYLRAWNSSVGETFRKALYNTNHPSTSFSELIHSGGAPNPALNTQQLLSNPCMFNPDPCPQPLQSNAIYQIDSTRSLVTETNVANFLSTISYKNHDISYVDHKFLSRSCYDLSSGSFSAPYNHSPSSSHAIMDDLCCSSDDGYNGMRSSIVESKDSECDGGSVKLSVKECSPLMPKVKLESIQDEDGKCVECGHDSVPTSSTVLKEEHRGNLTSPPSDLIHGWDDTIDRAIHETCTEEEYDNHKHLNVVKEVEEPILTGADEEDDGNTRIMFGSKDEMDTYKDMGLGLVMPLLVPEMSMLIPDYSKDEYHHFEGDYGSVLHSCHEDQQFLCNHNSSSFLENGGEHYWTAWMKAVGSSTGGHPQFC